MRISLSELKNQWDLARSDLIEPVLEIKPEIRMNDDFIPLLVARLSEKVENLDDLRSFLLEDSRKNWKLVYYLMIRSNCIDNPRKHELHFRHCGRLLYGEEYRTEFSSHHFKFQKRGVYPIYFRVRVSEDDFMLKGWDNRHILGNLTIV